MLAWGAVAAIAVIDLFGAVLELPRWVMNLSPFQHVPALPAEPFSALPIVVLIGCAALLTGTGILGLRRRDIG